MGAESETQLRRGGNTGVDVAPDPVPPPILREGPFRLISLGPRQLFEEALERAKQRAESEAKVKDKEEIPFEEIGDLLFPPKEKRVRKDDSGIVYIDFYKTLKMKPKKEKEKKYRHYIDGVESAIRACFHIVDKNKPQGETTQNLLGILDLTRLLYDEFTSGQINEANLPQYVEHAYKALEESHLVNPRSPSRQEAVKKILNALKKDSKDRFNPLKSRTQLGAAAIRIIEEILYTGFVEKKYSFIASLLLLERATERNYLNEVLNESRKYIDDTAKFKTIKHAREDTEELRDLFVTFLHPDVMLLKPYRQAALIAMALTFDFPQNPEVNKTWVESVSNSLPPEDAERIFNIIAERDKTRTSYSDIRSRVISSIDLLESVLQNGDRALNKYYDEIQKPTPSVETSVVV